ncbi:MAG: hypothetical protein LC790_15250, partial [Actinobacteria bacterium]|nr:hypothetical protein [Actinomycetota bacterium]
YAWLGVLAHENGHLDFSDHKASNAAIARGGPEAYVTLLEEPRMEARQASVRPHTHQLLRASANDVIWPLVAEHVAEHPQPDRALAAQVGCYIVGREHAGILTAAEAAPARQLCETLLGTADMARFDSILARQVSLPDDDVENRARLARELQELVGDPPAGAPPPAGPGQGGEAGTGGQAQVPDAKQPDQGGDGGDDGGGGAIHDGREDPNDTLRRIKQALEGASGQAADTLEEASHGKAGNTVGRLPARVLDELREDPEVAGPAHGASGGRYAGIPSGRPIPDHGNRAPIPHEIAARRKLAQRLARVRFVRDRSRLNDMPPGPAPSQTAAGASTCPRSATGSERSCPPATRCERSPR